MYLSSDGSVNNTSTSLLVLGGVDQRFFTAPMIYYKLLRSDFWIVGGLSMIYVGHDSSNVASICSSVACKVVFDSGTSWISGPKSILGILQVSLHSF